MPKGVYSRKSRKKTRSNGPTIKPMNISNRADLGAVRYRVPVVLVSEVLGEALTTHCEETGATVSGTVRQALESYLVDYL